MDIEYEIKHSILLLRATNFIKYFWTSVEQSANQEQGWKRSQVSGKRVKLIFTKVFLPSLSL